MRRSTAGAPRFASTPFVRARPERSSGAGGANDEDRGGAMRAVVIGEPGGVERLELCDVERPVAGPGQVLVRVRAVGVCHRDLLDREGRYPFMKRPVVTGHEFAGEVVEVGAGAGLAVGDRVVNLHRGPCGACEACRAGEETRCSGSLASFGLTVDGGYAEFVAADASALVALPAAVPFEQGAFLFCTAAVALRALRSRARLEGGETVLITGASGGVGIHAVQIARILGARVVAITSRAEKRAALIAAGADDVVVAGPAAFQREVLARTGGVHVALELVGEPTFNATLRSLRPGGRMVVVGNVTASRVEVTPGWLIMREAAILGSVSASRHDLADVLEWAARGRLKPVVAAVLPLAQARAAQGRVAAQDVIGRIVLVP
ncbi:MAG: zinc-binding dehydrogenase [Myxococcales bacterium]|nr:zinc-binding dehydrogenase [Myxococcales bacterium]